MLSLRSWIQRSYLYVDVRKKDGELYKSSAFSLHIKVIMV